MRQRILIGTAALGLVVFLAWWGASTLRPAAGPPFVEGQVLVYAVELGHTGDTDLRLLTEGDTGSRRSIRSRIKGELTVRVLSSDPRRNELAVEFHGEVRLLVDGEPDPALDRHIENSLKKAVFVTTDPDGRVKQVWLPAEMSAVSGGYARTLLAALQFVWPSGNEDRWEVDQDEPAGEACVRYEHSGTRVQITRLSYRQPSNTDDPDEVVITPTIDPKGFLVATVDPCRQLLELQGEEQTTMSLDGKVVGRTETTLRLSRLRVETMDETERAIWIRKQFAQCNNGALASLITPMASEEAMYRNQLGEMTGDQLLAELGKADRDREAGLYLKFRALVWLQPDQAVRLAEVLKAAPADGQAMRVLPLALARSGIPASQAALVGVVRARMHEEAVLDQFMTTLSLTRAPTEVVTQVLMEVVHARPDKETAKSAWLALGTLARKLKSRDPARGAAIVRQACDELAGARAPQRQRHFLLVLGNTASAEALPSIGKYLDHPDPEVRGAAVGALRSHTGEDEEISLCRALEDDKDEAVRLEAIAVFESRPPTRRAYMTLARALAHDPTTSVRLAVIPLLVRLSAHYLEAITVLRRAAENDPAAAVREAAQKVFEPG